MAIKIIHYCYNCEYFVRYYIRTDNRIIQSVDGFCRHARKRKCNGEPCIYWQAKEKPAVLHADFISIQETIELVRKQMDEILLQLSECGET